MKWDEFEYFLYSESFVYIFLVFLIFLILLFFLFKRNIFGIFDPLNIFIINYSSIFTVLLTLNYLKKIERSHFFEILLINTSLLLSYKFFLNFKFLSTKNSNKNLINLKKNEFIAFYFVHKLMFYTLMIFYVYLIGLSAHKNKLTAFENFGLLNYLKGIIFPGQLILVLIKKEVYKIVNKDDLLIMLLVFILFFTSGGKTSAITFILYISSTYYFLYKNNLSNIFLIYKKKEKKYFIYSLVGVFILFSFAYNLNSIVDLIKKIFFRIISTGDIYYMIFPNNLIEQLENVSLKKYFVYSMIAPIMRRFGYEGTRMGYEIIEKLYGISDPSFGPNTRADVVLKMNLGYYGIFVSIILGYFLARLRNIKIKSFFWLYIFINLMVMAENQITDFALFGMLIFTLIFLVTPIYFLVKYTTIIFYKIREV